MRFIALAASVLFVFLSQKTYLADSEIWSITLSNLPMTPLGGHEYGWTGVGQMMKVLHHLLLKLLLLWPYEDASLYLFIRFVSSFIGIGIAWQAAILYTHFFGQRHLKWWVFLAVLSSSFFLERGFRVRADMLALLFHLLAVNYFIQNIWRPGLGEAKKKKVLKLVLLELVMVFSSFKWFLIYVVQQILFLYLARFHRDTKEIHKVLIKKTLVTFEAFLAIGVGVVIYGGDKVSKWVTDTATGYFSSTFQGGQGLPDYFSRESFMYVYDFVLLNPFISIAFYVICFRLILTFVRKGYKVKRPLQRAGLIYSFMCLMLIFLYGERYPYWIAAISTGIVLVGFRGLHQGAFKALESLKLKWPVVNKLNTSVATLFLLGLLIAYKFYSNTFYILNNKNNADQVAFINYFKAYLVEHPKVTYYDVIGIAPKKLPLIAFVGPHQMIQNALSAIKVNRERPDIILSTGKFSFLQNKPEIKNMLFRRYAHLGVHIYVAATFMSEKLVKQSGGVHTDGRLKIPKEIIKKSVESDSSNPKKWMERKLYFYRWDEHKDKSIPIKGEWSDEAKAYLVPPNRGVYFISYVPPLYSLLPVDIRKLFTFDRSY